MKEEDMTMQGTHISPTEAPAGTADIHVLVETQRNNDVSDFDEETFLATAFLENPWPEEEEEQVRSDFLCSSTVNLDQLFDLGDSLGGDPSTRIDTLLWGLVAVLFHTGNIWLLENYRLCFYTYATFFVPYKMF